MAPAAFVAPVGLGGPDGPVDPEHRLAQIQSVRSGNYNVGLGADSPAKSRSGSPPAAENHSIPCRPRKAELASGGPGGPDGPGGSSACFGFGFCHL